MLGGKGEWLVGMGEEVFPVVCFGQSSGGFGVQLPSVTVVKVQQWRGTQDNQKRKMVEALEFFIFRNTLSKGD